MPKPIRSSEPKLTHAQCVSICKTISGLVAHREPTDRDEARHLLFLGVLLAKGQNALPPDWVINILAGRTDRILNPTLPNQ